MLASAMPSRDEIDAKHNVEHYHPGGEVETGQAPSPLKNLSLLTLMRSFLRITNQINMFRKIKVNWGVVINAILTCVTTVISAITLHSCVIH